MDRTPELGGDWQVLGHLGRGAAGDVYRVRGSAGTELALKVLHRPWTLELEREFRAARRLRHPTLPAVQDFGHTPDGRPYFTMDLVRGRPITALDPGEAESLLRALTLQLLDGLAHIHGRGFIHADLKPGNLLVTDGEPREARILDLGLAFRFRLGGRTDLRGTPGYIAPELLKGWRVDPRSDLFSLGAVLHEVMCGRPAFAGASQLERVRATLAHPPGARAAGWPDTELAALVARLLEPHPSRRYASAEAAAERLRGRAAALPAEARFGPAETVGREEELRLIMAEEAGIVLLRGPVGSGKSRLIEEARLRRGVQGEREGEAFLALDDLECRGAEALRREAFLVESALARGGRVLLALSTDVEPEDSAALAAFLAEMGGQPGFVTRELAAIPRESAAALLAGLLGEEPDAVREAAGLLWEASGGLPGSLEEAALRLARHGALRRAGALWILDGDPAGGRPREDVAQRIAARLDSLAPEERALLRRLSVAEGEVSWGDAARVAGGERERFQVTARSIIERGFLRESGDGLALRLESPLLRRVLRDELDAEETRRCDAALAGEASGWGPRGRGLARLRHALRAGTEPALARRAAREAALLLEREGRHDLAGELLELAASGARAAERRDLLLASAGAWLDAGRHGPALSALAAARATAAGEETGAALRTAELLARAGRWEEAGAAYARLAEQARGAGGLPAASRAEAGLARVAAATGQGGDAVERAERALALARECGDEEALREALFARGAAAEAVGDLPGARAAHEALLAAGAPPREALRALARLGAVSRLAGDLRGATGRHQEALRLAREHGLAAEEAAALNALAFDELSGGDRDGAAARLDAAAALAEALLLEPVLAETSRTRGALHYARAEFQRAEAEFGRARRLFARLNDARGVAASLNNLGLVAQATGRLEEAQSRYRECLAQAAEAGDRSLQAIGLNNLAIAQRHRGDYLRAVEGFERSLALKRDLGQRQGVPHSLVNLAEALARLGEWTRCEEAAREALALAEEAGQRSHAVAARLRLARARMRRGRTQEALEEFARLEDAARELGDGEAVAVASGYRALAGLRAGDREGFAGRMATLLPGLEAIEPHESVAFCCLDWGREAAAAGAHREARPLLEQAAKVARAVGASRTEEEAADALRRLPAGRGGSEHESRARFALGGHAWSSSTAELSSEKLRVLYEAIRCFASIHDPAELHPRILDLAMATVQAERGALFLRDPQGALKPAAARPGSRDSLEAFGRVSRTVLAEADRAAGALLAADALHDPRFTDAPSIRQEGTRSILCAPLRGRDRVLGCLYLDSASGANLFGENEAEFITAIAEGAVLALENCRLYADLREARNALRRENAELRREVSRLQLPEDFVGNDAGFAEALTLAERAARTRSSVLIVGETGTGKELIARLVHARSPRAGKPFVRLNCAAIPETLLEAELFGIEKGTATGVDARVGRFEQADGGTLLLDEVGDMPPAMQARLLRVLQEREIERVGGRKVLPVDVRVLAATSRDLERMTAEGRFREDLLYRLDVVRIRLPPLRERPGDIPLLAQHFLGRFARQRGGEPAALEEEALRALRAYPWPGNVRELQNVIERACVLGEGPRIGLRDLPPGIGGTASGPGPAAGERALKDALAEPERRLILQALESAGWNRELAAKRLRITRNTLYVKMKRLGLAPGPPRAARPRNGS